MANLSLDVFNCLEGHILFFEPFMSPLIVSGVDLAIQLSRKGCRVSFIYISQNAPLPDFRIGYSRLLGASESRLHNKINRILMSNRIEILQLPIIESATLEDIRSFANNTPETLSELRHYTYKGHNIGLAVLSSIISIEKSAFPDLSKLRRQVKLRLYTSALIYERSLLLLSTQSPDFGVFFNGRSANSFPIEAALESSGTPKVARENRPPLNTSTSSAPKIRLSFTKIHNAAHNRKNIVSAAQQTPQHLITQYAQEYFHTVFSSSFYSFNKNVIDGDIPSYIHGKNVFLFICSNEDEALAIFPNKINSLFPTQFEAIHFLDAFIKAHYPDHLFLVKVHPSTVLKANREKKTWENLTLQSGRIINYWESFDSVALMKASKLVFTYGSSLTLLANYLSIPTILLNNAEIWSGMSIAFEPATISDIGTTISTALTSPPLSKQPAENYASWVMQDGIEYTSFSCKNDWFYYNVDNTKMTYESFFSEAIRSLIK